MLLSWAVQIKYLVMHAHGLCAWYSILQADMHHTLVEQMGSLEIETRPDQASGQVPLNIAVDREAIPGDTR